MITHEEEEKLWESGQLGDSTPQQLLDTIVFLYFALRSGKELRQLRCTPPQRELFQRPGERAYLRYREDVSKNHPGGLKARNIPSKVVYHHVNLENPQRCFIRLYNSRCTRWCVLLTSSTISNLSLLVLPQPTWPQRSQHSRRDGC